MSAARRSAAPVTTATGEDPEPAEHGSMTLAIDVSGGNAKKLHGDPGH